MNDYFNLAFEQTVLCSIILSPNLLDTISLKPKIFFSQAHQNIANAILTLQHSNKPIDEQFLYNELSKKQILDESVLLAVLSANPAANITPYIDTLIKIAKKREILASLANIKNLSEEMEGDELLSYFQNTAEKLRDDESLDAFTISNMNTLFQEEPHFICKDWIPIPKKTITIFSAGGGTGKTYAALQLAIRYIRENNFHKKVFLWLSEDPGGISKKRAQDICNSVLHEPSEKYLPLVDISDSPTFPVITFKSSGEGVVKTEFYQMKHKLKDYELIIIDPLIGFFAGDENNNAHARQFMQLFTQWAAQEEKTIIFIHHSSKGNRVGGESKSRGASAFVDAVRAVYEFEKIKANDFQTHAISNDCLRRVLLTKDNYGAYRYFGHQNDLKLFPKQAIDTVQIFEDESHKRPKILKNKAIPARKSSKPLGALIKIVDLPGEMEPSAEEAAIIEKKIKDATAAGLKFED